MRNGFGCGVARAAGMVLAMGQGNSIKATSRTCGTYCHNASLWRSTRCQLRSSGSRLCCEPDREEGEAEAEAEAEADDGLSLSRADPEKETLEGNRSASFGLSGDMTVFQRRNGLERVEGDDCKDRKKEE